MRLFLYPRFLDVRSSKQWFLTPFSRACHLNQHLSCCVLSPALRCSWQTGKYLELNIASSSSGQILAWIGPRNITSEWTRQTHMSSQCVSSISICHLSDYQLRPTVLNPAICFSWIEKEWEPTYIWESKHIILKLVSTSISSSCITDISCADVPVPSLGFSHACHWSPQLPCLPCSTPWRSSSSNAIQGQMPRLRT